MTVEVIFNKTLVDSSYQVFLSIPIENLDFAIIKVEIKWIESKNNLKPDFSQRFILHPSIKY